MLAWLKRFGLHMAAAIGATGIFVAAAAVGANQTRQQVVAISAVEVPSPTPRVRRKPTVEVVATPTPASNAARTQPGPTQGAALAGAQPNLTPALPSPTQLPAGSADVQPAPDDTPPGQADPLPGLPEAAPGVVQNQPGAQPPAPAAVLAPTPGAPNPPTPRANPPRRTPTPVPAVPVPTARVPATAPTPEKVAPERSLAGTIQDILPDGLDVLGVGGREWRVTPAPGALIRLNGKAAPLDTLRVGDTVVILGQAEAKEGSLFRFLSHAITARRK